MKKTIILFLFSVLFLFNPSARSDEGMWIPLLLEQLNESEMQSMGMKITAEDIYSINKSSLKDAIILFGGGCTAEIISDKGLILTNHHCGYGRIQSHSSVDKNYLKNGFWAQHTKEELMNEGLTATLLIRMEDVTGKIMAEIHDEMSPVERDARISKIIGQIESEAIEGTHYEAKVKPFYYGNQYFLFITEVFRDIRLVGAPPESIGKFGGDTDNWMWPRHTGDFSLFRIYVDKNNKPADPSENNIPYSPKKHLKISLDGYDKGDFTFVFGYPGRTQEYLPSFALEMITRVENPASISMREKKLGIMSSYMEKETEIRIKYAAKYARVANFWKKMIGENRGIKRLDAINVKKEEEKAFREWANADKKRKSKYGDLLDKFEKMYQEVTPHNLAFNFFYEAVVGTEILMFARNFQSLVEVSQKEDATDKEINEAIEQLKKATKNHFKDYFLPIDKDIFISMFSMYYHELDESLHPGIFQEITNDYKGNIREYAKDIYKKSIFVSEESTLEFLEKYKQKHVKKILKDPAYNLSAGIFNHYFTVLLPALRKLNGQLDELQHTYMKAQMEMHPDKRFYPDANSTLRVAYGKVNTYFPKDAVEYLHFTTLKGVMEKDNPEIYDYVVDEKLKELFASKDYGQYADEDGSIHVCFIASNHTTGGNSGSPLLNAEGELIGINFDRNWEGTMSDLMYDPEQCRNISLDIRYCLFVIDKFAGAGHLVEEMTLVKDGREEELLK